jgi:phosphate transport system substrate-binding protein
MSSGSASSMNPADDTIVRRQGSGRTALYATIAVVIVVVLIVVVAWQAGWFGTSGSSPKPNGTGCTPPASTAVSGAGGTFVFPLMYQWETVYTAAQVNYQAVGSGAGIQQITAKTVDFGGSDAPLNPAQRAGAPGLLTLPESAGAVVPIYNIPGLGTTLKFDGATLASIYLGTITNWNDSALQALNPGVSLPNQNIIVVHRSDGSGTTFIWTSYLSSQSSTWASQVGHATSVNWPTGVGSKGNSGVTQTVASTSYAVGYVDINYALTNGLAFGKVKNPAGNFIEASLNNSESAIKDSNPTFPAANGDWYNFSVLNAPGAGDYPITSFTYLLVYGDLSGAFGSSMSLTTAENLANFLEWIITSGQTYAGPLYYIPLPSNVVTEDKTTIASLTYNGAAVPLCAGS